MKLLRFLIFLILAVVTVWALNSRFGSIPPLGKLLNPFDGIWQNAEEKVIEWPQEITFEALQQEVIVRYDDRRVPHIFAENEQDLLFLQGYVTARDRIWQMELLTHLVAGRLSEVVGKDALAMDRESRRLGLHTASKKTLTYIEADQASKDILDAYTAGVNAFINSLSSSEYPVEYKILDYQPERWTNLKTVMIQKYMSQYLTGYEQDWENTHLLHKLGRTVFDKLYPDFPDGIEPVIPDAGESEVEYPALPVDTPEVVVSEAIVPRPEMMQADPTTGSNNWAVSGDKTVSGKPLLANDTHLGLTLPSLFYEVQLSAPGLNAYGASLPGTPGIILGFNESIAWGMTNSGRDYMDWYLIRFSEENRDYYYLEDTVLPVLKVVEKFEVRGENPFYDTVMHTHFGPIVFDENFKSDSVRQNMALQWVGARPSNPVKALNEVMKAHNHEEFQTAIAAFKDPPQNFVFASIQGDIALHHQGSWVLKWPEQGKFIMDGNRIANDWQGMVPVQYYPSEKNPERGYVSSANQHPVDSTYPYYYTGHFEYFRNKRIHDVLGDSTFFSAEEMMELQLDNFNLFASQVLPHLMAFLDGSTLSEKEKELYAILQDWDYYNNPTSKGAAVFQAWWDTLEVQLYDELVLTQKRPFKYAPPLPVTIQLLQEEPDHAIFDHKQTPELETAADVVQKAFIDATTALSSWLSENDTLTWSNYRPVTLGHLSQVLNGFSRTISTGGGANIVNATKEDHGPAWRLIVSLENPVRAWGIIPGGQSGNPASYYYDNAVDDWAAGNYYEFHFLKSAEENPAVIQFTQTFLPE